MRDFLQFSGCDNEISLLHSVLVLVVNFDNEFMSFEVNAQVEPDA